MLEEEAHRNFAFTMFHGGEMPKLAFDRTKVERLGGRLWSVTVEVRNEKIIPTRTARARQAGIGASDLLICEPARGVDVVASGKLASWWDTTLDEVRHEPARVRYDEGVGSRSSIVHRFLIEGKPGARLTLRYEAEKARDIETTVTLEETPADE
jgi:hypothetical protein